jgi:hypothetical protein
MAKGKHATALFEVIHSAKTTSNGRNNAGLLRTPKWWFKGREKSGSSTPAAPAPAALPAAEMMPSFDSAPSDPTRPTAPPINLGVDPDKQQITFKLTYSGTIIASFAILVIVGLAYVIGRHGTGVSSANAGVSTEQIRNGPIHKDVLNVASGLGPVGISSSSASNATNESEGYSAPPAKTNGGTASASHLVIETPRPAPQAAGAKAQRIIGMQYVIVQSYPDDAKAEEAVKLLNENGIDATKENLSWYSKWPCVVGTTGFDRIKNNPQYDHYVEQIESVSQKFLGRAKFKQFAPAPVRWK